MGKEANKKDKEIVVKWVEAAIKKEPLKSKFAAIFKPDDIYRVRVPVSNLLRRSAPREVVQSMRLFDNSQQYTEIMRRATKPTVSCTNNLVELKRIAPDNEHLESVNPPTKKAARNS